MCHLLIAVTTLQIPDFRCDEYVLLFLSVVASSCRVCGYGHFGECVCRRSAVLMSLGRRKKLNKFMYGHIELSTKILTSTIYSQNGVFILPLSTLLLANSAKPSTIFKLRN